MLEVYGFDLIAEWPTLSLRKLGVLVEHLPPDSPVFIGPERWSRQDQLIAALIEIGDARLHGVLKALGWKVKGEPVKLERPEEQQKEREITTDTKQIAAWFARHSGA